MQKVASTEHLAENGILPYVLCIAYTSGLVLMYAIRSSSAIL